jgi:uncharacterized protein YcnI
VSRRLLSALAATALASAALAAPAGAHIQIRPTAVAPGDPVLFDIIVPGERDAHTTKIQLQIPKDVLPFSWQASPGWKRTTKLKADGSIDVVTWTGRLDEDGFARFSFLASTPEQEGEITWKALQFYDDGTEAAWIGAPDSENPAPVTRVSAATARENAGGESGGGGAEAEAGGTGAAASATPTAAASDTATVTTNDDGDSPVPLILGIVALAVALAALFLALRRPRRAAPLT